MTHTCAQGGGMNRRDKCVGSMCACEVGFGQRQGVYTRVCLIDKEKVGVWSQLNRLDRGFV